MDYGRKLLIEKFIEPYLKKDKEYIGVEIEYPVILPNNNFDSKKMILELFGHLKEKYSFKDDKFDIHGSLISIKNDIGDKITLEGRYEIIEFAMQKDLNINNIAERTFSYFNIVQNFLAKYNCFLTGMGTNLTDNPSRITLLESDLEYAIHNYIK